jgi:serine/threonine protein phosphatase PrpC
MTIPTRAPRRLRPSSNAALSAHGGIFPWAALALLALVFGGVWVILLFNALNAQSRLRDNNSVSVTVNQWNYMDPRVVSALAAEGHHSNSAAQPAKSNLENASPRVAQMEEAAKKISGGKLSKCFDFGCVYVPFDYDKDYDEINSIVQGWELHASEEVQSLHAPDFGMMTRQSNAHIFNQDRVLLVRPFIVRPASNGDESSNFLLCVFDGHAEMGHDIATFLQDRLPSLLAAKLDSDTFDTPLTADRTEWVKQTLHAVFLEMQDLLPLPEAYRGGSTASVSLRLGQQLFVANLGDSQVVLTQHFRTKGQKKDGSSAIEPVIFYRNELHKPGLPEEKRRIEAAGGKVHMPADVKDSRVVTFCAHAVPPEAITLAMSRSFGDNDFKKVGVTAEPTIDVVDLNAVGGLHNSTEKGELVLVAATDGLWDLRMPGHGPIYLAQRFGVSWFGPDTSPPLYMRRGGTNAAQVGRTLSLRPKSASNLPHPLRSIFDTVREESPASPAQYRDDISLVVLRLSS